MFDNNKLGEIRPNQLITTFGPGSIVDAVKDSVTVLDLNYWKEKGKKIIDGRLASYLGVDCFYMPRTSYSGDIPVVSFPYMHVCSNVKCGRIFDLRENFDLDRYLKFGVTCPECHRQAYPSRFITICENGHMDDFPWSWWVHGGNTTCKGMMRMYSTGNTSTLAFPFFFFLSHYKQERKVKGCRNKHFVDLQQLQASLEKQWGVF